MTISIHQSPDLVGEITPLLNAMREALEAKTQSEAEATREGVAGVKSDVAHVQEATQAARTDIATVKSDVDDLTTVNGQISTEVLAINAHTSTEIANANAYTSSELSKLPKSAIKNIYRGRTTYKNGETGQITIPTVNTKKTVVNLLSIVSTYGNYNGNAQERWGWLELVSSNTLQHHFDKTYSSTPHYISWEVIEYA